MDTIKKQFEFQRIAAKQDEEFGLMQLDDLYFSQVMSSALENMPQLDIVELVFGPMPDAASDADK